MNRVLFISYFWPPSSKASMHWQFKVVKHLPDFGWEPAVLTVPDDIFESRDESLMSEMNPSLIILKQKPLDPFRLYKRLIGKDRNQPVVDSETISRTNTSIRHRIAVWIRMNIFIPDARVGWYLNAVSCASDYLKKNKVQAIVSIGPPHSSHLISMRLSKKFNIPFIPVLQDPWSDIVYYNEFSRIKITRMIDKYFEKKVLSAASRIVFVNKTTRDDYVSKYSWIKEKTNVLYWGYSEENFQGISRTRRDTGEIIIVHSGNIFDFQNPSEFWKYIKTLLDQGKRIRLRFTGTVAPLIREDIIKNGISEITEYMGVLRYTDMLQELVNADVLLVCPNEKRHVPGKLFEYLRAGVPVLAISDDNDEVKNLLSDTGAGIMIHYGSDASEFFDRRSSFSPDAVKIRQYERRIIAQNFSCILNN